ncbi:MAG: ankyrin [bacterium P3]|nr:MAG: ankyrin [bacterium P3]
MKKYSLLILMVLSACIGGEENYLGYNIELWKDTEVWDFANCISKGNFKKAERLLGQNQININFKESKFGETLLHWAVMNDNLDAVKFLVNHGANPNAHDTYNGQSPISIAASEFNSIEILNYLLAHGGNPNDYVKESEVLSYERSLETPLIGAAFISLEKTKRLVAAGADVNFAVKPGYTAFYNAAISKHKDILAYLIYTCKMDYTKTFVVTVDNDTLYLKDILDKEYDTHPEDSVIIKRIQAKIGNSIIETYQLK